jgi:RNA polymerase sigma factor (sigma-70 family)
MSKRFAKTLTHEEQTNQLRRAIFLEGKAERLLTKVAKQHLADMAKKKGPANPGLDRQARLIKACEAAIEARDGERDALGLTSNHRALQLLQECARIRWQIAMIWSGLALKAAKKFVDRRFDVPLDEALQAAHLGLFSAAKRFDPERGYVFMTYATWWVRAALEREFPVDERSFAEQEVWKNIQKLERAGITRDEDIAEYLGIKVKQVARKRILHHQATRILSLDDPAPGGGREGEDGGRLIDVIAAPESEYDSADRLDMVRLVRALEWLPERERDIIVLRFGLNGPPMSFAEVGEQYGLSRERIRQIESTAKDRLRDIIGQPRLAKMIQHPVVKKSRPRPVKPKVQLDNIIAIVAAHPDGVSGIRVGKLANISNATALKYLYRAVEEGKIEWNGQSNRWSTFYPNGMCPKTTTEEGE